MSAKKLDSKKQYNIMIRSSTKQKLKDIANYKKMSVSAYLEQLVERIYNNNESEIKK